MGGAGPGPDQDLEHGVVSVEAEEVVDGCLGGGERPHAGPGVLVVQQLQAPPGGGSTSAAPPSL